MDSETCFRFGLAHLPSFGQARLGKLLDLFVSAESLWGATLQDLYERNVPTKLAEQFLNERRTIDIDNELANCTQYGIAFVHRGQQDYPALLQQIPDAPLGFFYLGRLPKLEYRIAIVGTRRPTQYGTQMTREITAALAQCGMVTVSGLAMGIDGAVHRETLRAGGKTIAVIASGLDRIYPIFHHALAREIVEQDGVIISEFPCGTPALRHHFPIRNRIIAGLSHGVVVTEAPEKSGALLTASLGLEYNRDIFAVPGPVTSLMSRGSNNLIRNGANLIQHADDVLDFYHLGASSTPAQLDLATLTTTEQIIMQQMDKQPTTVDQLAKVSTLDTSVVNATLILLQMKQCVAQLDPLHYIRIR